MRSDVAIIEVRGATGGDEAKLWAQDLMRMYSRYAAIRGWKTEALDELVLRVKGPDAFTVFQWESGVHRVQRIPSTERYGRIHTSTATVAALPELEETAIHVNPGDLEWEFYRSGGKGGQNVNKVSTAVRLRHRPSGIVVECQQERYQGQNRENALRMLRGKLWEKEEEKKQEALGSARLIIGRGMRSEKIRTYNFPQNRITDHRINKSWHNLDAIMSGKMDKMVNDLTNTGSHSER